MTTAISSSPASSKSICAITPGIWGWRHVSTAAALALALGAVPASASEPFPTVDRVEYVLECMKNNGGRYDYIYKCSCAIDAIARQLSYDEYVEAATIARYQGMPGERMAEFRDPPSAKAIAQRYRALQTEVKKSCDVPR